jgi:WD40 repeat protein/energy-coupling factor transporter ATP-binding protein EcfA2
MVKFRNIALIIGINEYGNADRIANLTTAQFDAIKLGEILKDYGYDVELLTDEHQKATCDGIRQALGRLPDRLKPLQVENNNGEEEKVRLVFYFAGHGIASQGEDGEAGYLVAQDAELEQLKNFLPMKELHNALTELICDHVLIILDCCFAGAFKFNTRHLGFQQKPEEITKKHYERYINGAAWQVIASAAHDQKALDIALDNRVKSEDIGKLDISEKPNSPFAAALFRALDKTDQKTLNLDILHKPADYTKDGITTATELFVFLEKEMWQKIHDSNHQQVPRFWPLSKHGKGEFFFETGEFDPDRLPDTPELSQDNNPYRGLESFDEAQQRFFFGREELVKELQAKVDKYSFAIVLGVSGSGKSSLVKAGLIPKLRQLKDTSWKILMPMRPGLSPLKALAKVMLVLEQEENSDEYQQLENLTEKLRAARKEYPGVKDLTNLLTAWLRSDPDGKLHLIVKEFEQWKQFAKNERDHIQLGNLRQAALQRSSLVLEHLEDLKKDCSDEEKQQLEKFYQDCVARIEVWSNEWRSNPEHLYHLIADWGEKHPAYKLLLVIDQFEELITLSQDDERKSFLLALKSIIQTSSQQLRVVVTLRADFESRFSGSEYLKDFWKLENRFFVRPMQRYEFRQVIEGPAEDYVLAFEINKEKENYSLVDQLIDEVELMPGGLPLLSFTLSELYREYVRINRDDRTLSWEDYEKLQGVAGSLTRRATQEYDALDEKHQATMQRVMLRMVAIDGGGVTRRRVPEPELIYPNDKENERVKLVIDKLVDARLTVKGQEAEEQPYIEPAHDFLVRGWDKLQKWIKENQEDLALQQRLIPAALDWKQRNGVLWTEDFERLAKLEVVLHSKTNNWINKLETDFVVSSIKERQDRIKKLEEDLHISEERLLAAELELDSIALLRQVGIAQSLESLLLAMKNCKRLQNWRNNYDLPVSSYPSISPLFTLQTILDNIHEQNRLQVSRSDSLWMLLDEEKIDQVDINTEKPDIFLSPDHIHFVTLKDNVVELWKISGELVAQLSSGERNLDSISFNPDGQIIIATASSEEGDHLVILWDTSGFLIRTINAIKYSGINILFSPDSQKLAVLEESGGGEEPQIVRFFQLKKDRGRFEILPIGDEVGQGRFGKVGFTKDGKYLVTRINTNYGVRLFKFWNLQLRLQLRIAENNYQEIMNIEDDDTSLSIEWSDGIAKFHKDLTQPAPIAILNGNQSWFSRAIFIPNNQCILTTGDDSAVRVWSLAGKQLTDAKVYQNQIDNIFFSKDEQYIAVLGNEGVTIIQDLLSQKEIGKIIGTRSFSRISFSPDGQRFATVDLERMVRIWDLKGRQLAQLNLLSPQVSLVTGRNWSTGDGTNPQVGFTIDGKYVVIYRSEEGGGNPTLLWKVEGLDELMHRGCCWLSDYLNNPDINESDKNLCGNSLQVGKSV